LPGLVLNLDLPVSTSQVARLTDVSQHTLIFKINQYGRGKDIRSNCFQATAAEFKWSRTWSLNTELDVVHINHDMLLKGLNLGS
jgi:hypothetical protein